MLFGALQGVNAAFDRPVKSGRANVLLTVGPSAVSLPLTDLPEILQVPIVAPETYQSARERVFATHRSGAGEKLRAAEQRQRVKSGRNEPRESETLGGGHRANTVRHQACAIETLDVTRRFGERTVLHQVSLRVPESGVYGFLGLNGAGKTTTIRLLLGLIKADAGSIELFGQPFNRDALRRIGSLVEMPSLYPHLTGRENLNVTRIQAAAPRSSIDHVLTVVGLANDADRLVRQYSLGMKQRLGLALALLNSPDLLILDEPTNGLDPAGIHEIRDLLRRMPREHGVTVFLSSHLLNEVEQIAEFVGIIHEGKILFQGALAELRERHNQPLRVGVHGTDKAAELLRAAGLDARIDGPDSISIRGMPIDASLIVRMLVQAGHQVFHASIQQNSLEDIFLSLTGGRAQ
jgi:ABC-2 type transport system ATP-binding protein